MDAQRPKRILTSYANSEGSGQSSYAQSFLCSLIKYESVNDQ